MRNGYAIILCGDWLYGAQYSKNRADVAELADARDLKSRGKRFPYRFDPGHRHQRKKA